VRLSNFIKKSFPFVEINVDSASTQTGAIEVGWIVNGQKTSIWKKEKAETEKTFAEITQLLK
jgi:hypothetical protein